MSLKFLCSGGRFAGNSLFSIMCHWSWTTNLCVRYVWKKQFLRMIKWFFITARRIVWKQDLPRLSWQRKSWKPGWVAENKAFCSPGSQHGRHVVIKAPGLATCSQNLMQAHEGVWEDCPLQKLREVWAIAFSDLISGIVWVSSVNYNWSMVSKVTVNQS